MKISSFRLFHQFYVHKIFKKLHINSKNSCVLLASDVIQNKFSDDITFNVRSEEITVRIRGELRDKANCTIEEATVTEGVSLSLSPSLSLFLSLSFPLSLSLSLSLPPSLPHRILSPVDKKVAENLAGCKKSVTSTEKCCRKTVGKGEGRF